MNQTHQKHDGNADNEKTIKNDDPDEMTWIMQL